MLLRLLRKGVNVLVTIIKTMDAKIFWKEMETAIETKTVWGI
jgi:hypothetical protein